MKKRTWAATGGLKAAVPPLKGSWVPHDTRDEIVDYVRYWTDRAETPTKQIIVWAGLCSSKFYDWNRGYGKVNEHNGLVPRDCWLEEWEATEHACPVGKRAQGGRKSMDKLPRSVLNPP